jgi:hypothetical protein
MEINCRQVTSATLSTHLGSSYLEEGLHDTNIDYELAVTFTAKNKAHLILLSLPSSAGMGKGKVSEFMPLRFIRGLQKLTFLRVASSPVQSSPLSTFCRPGVYLVIIYVA